MPLHPPPTIDKTSHKGTQEQQLKGLLPKCNLTVLMEISTQIQLYSILVSVELSTQMQLNPFLYLESFSLYPNAAFTSYFLLL